MKFIKICSLLFLCSVFFSCQNNRKQSQTSTLNVLVENDIRPKDEIYFLNRVKIESDYEITSNAVKKDNHIKAFNKYALDSLKKVTDWEMIVTEVNDMQNATSSFAEALGINNNPVYNLLLVAPIKIDNSVDTIAIDNRVDFTYTMPKEPKGDELKRQLTIIKTLNKGDTVIVSGALAHLDNKLKVNFASFYDETLPWNVDLLLTDIRKKGQQSKPLK